MLPFKVRNAMCASPCKQGRAWAAAGRFGEAVGEYTDCTAVLGLVAPLQNSLHSPHLFDHSERSERRKLCGATPE